MNPMQMRRLWHPCRASESSQNLTQSLIDTQEIHWTLEIILHLKQAVWIEWLTTTVSLMPCAFSSSLFLWPSIKRRQKPSKNKAPFQKYICNDITLNYTVVGRTVKACSPSAADEGSRGHCVPGPCPAGRCPHVHPGPVMCTMHEQAGAPSSTTAPGRAALLCTWKLRQLDASLKPVDRN